MGIKQQEDTVMKTVTRTTVTMVLLLLAAVSMAEPTTEVRQSLTYP